VTVAGVDDEMGAAMADLPPRYAYRVGPAERDLWADDDDDTSMPPRELETRRWMLVTATVGAGVLIVALPSVLVLGGGGSRPFQGDDRTTANVEQAGAPVATSEVSSSGTGASAAAATTNNADARQLAEARAGLAAMEAQLKSTTERADDLDRRLAAFEQTAAITTRRAEGAEAALVAEQGERARVQRDLDAMSGDLTQANADRAALRVQLQDAQAQAASSRAQAGGLAAEGERLRTCLAVHQEALYYTTLDNWGLLATAMQDAAASCAADLD